jgi:hypothetical protein
MIYFAEEQAELVNDDAVLFLQPEWSKERRNDAANRGLCNEERNGEFHYKHINT